VTLNQQENIHFSRERRKRIMNCVQFFVHKRIIEAIKLVECVSDRTLCIILGGHWLYIIVLNIHAPTGDNIDVKDGFYNGLKYVFSKFPEYHMNPIYVSQV
jgi:hypothetical protein